MKNPHVEKILDDLDYNKNEHLELKGEEEEKVEEKEPETEVKAEEPEVKEEPQETKAVKEKPKKAKQPAKKTKKVAKEQPATAKHHFLDDKAITIKLNPRQFVKWVVVILLFVSVFYFGRLTVGDTCTLEATAPDVVDSPTFISGISGFFTKIIPNFTDEEITTDTTEDTDPIDEEETPSADEEEAPAEDPVEPEPVPVADEPIITTYTKVELSLEDITIDWKGTWGKVTKFKYKIVNKESGTIKPSYIVMRMEGYDDELAFKKITLAKGSQTIGSLKAIGSTATFPSGFAYNELETGDLSTVQITLQLYDEDGALMDAISKNMDLNG